MSNITADEMLPLFVREIHARRGALLGIFTGLALVFLVVGALWEKKYTSYVRLYVDDQRTVAPLVGAETGQSRDQANLAQEELFSTEVLDRVLDDVGYFQAGMSAVERERLKEDLIENTEIFNINNQLIEIAFQHSVPRIAFETVTSYADLFLERTMRSSAEETSEAFEFIIDQVETYRTKLEDTEKRLESFRSQYPGLSGATEGNVDQRIIELRRQLEETQLQYAEAEQRRKSLDRELSSESSTIARDYQANQIRDRVAELQTEVELLRLSYTDDYPDIVRLKQQIQDYVDLASAQQVRDQTRGDSSAAFSVNGRIFNGAANSSPVYQQLRSDLARSAATADSLRSKVQQLRVLLDKEVGRSAISSRVERELSELTREQAINKEIFEDLLRRQESARLSMTLGAEKQGVLYRIIDPPVFPYLPTGLRFIHIAIGGIFLALLVPFVYLFVFLKLDPRVRTPSAVTDILDLPLLTVVPHLIHPHEKPKFFHRPGVIASVVVVVFMLYGAVAIGKLLLATQGEGGGII